MEIRDYYYGQLNKKIIYKYNAADQRVLEDIYKKNGLMTSTKYFYKNNSSKKNTIIKEIHEYFGKNPYQVQVEFERNNNDQITKTSQKYFVKGNFKCEYVTKYSEFKENKATEIIETGSYPFPADSSGNFEFSSPCDINTSLKFDSIGNIKYYKTLFDEPKRLSIKRLLLSRFFTFEYFYNEHNDWIKLIIFDNSKSTSSPLYIVYRETRFINNKN